MLEIPLGLLLIRPRFSGDRPFPSRVSVNVQSTVVASVLPVKPLLSSWSRALLISAAIIVLCMMPVSDVLISGVAVVSFVVSVNLRLNPLFRRRSTALFVRLRSMAPIVKFVFDSPAFTKSFLVYRFVLVNFRLTLKNILVENVFYVVFLIAFDRTVLVSRLPDTVNVSPATKFVDETAALIFV